MKMVTLVLVKNPFSPQDGREVRHIEYKGTIGTLLEQNVVSGVELQATVNGYGVSPDKEIKDGDFIVIYPAVEKGGGKGGKSILGIVAAIALSVVSFGIASGGWLASSGFWAAGHLGAYMAAAAVMFLGSSLMGRMAGQKVDTGSYDGGREDATYSWGQVQTMEGQNNAIALTYGMVKSGGQTIGKYVSVDDNDEYLNWLVACGEGPLSITDIKLNDNDIGDFADVSVEKRSGVNDQAVISNFNDTYSTKNLSYLLTEEWRTESAPGAAAQGLVIDIEFPNGLYHLTDRGDTTSAYLDLDIEYRKVNEDGTYGDWVNVLKEVADNSYGVSLAQNVAAGNYALKLQGTGYSYFDYDDYRQITYFNGVDITIGTASTHMSRRDFSKRRTATVGKFKVDTSAWSSSVCSTLEDGGSVTGTITVNGSAGATGRITESSKSAVRKQFRVNKIAEGAYEVRVKVLARQYAEDDDMSQSSVYWTAVESIVYDDFCYPCTALIGIRAKATDQLNGSPSLTFLKERKKVWVWNGSAYVQKNANNPAWACYDLLHQARQLTNINTGETEMEVRGVPAERMRYADFNRWAAWCDSMKLYVNIEINTVGEVLEVANQKIAPIGRGMVVRFGTRYGCIYDHVQEPVQMFNMGNIKQGTFSEEFLKVADRANCVEVTFTNSKADYERDVLTIYGDTFDSDGYAKTAQLTLDGVTSYEQAYREGKYQLMCNKYQLRTVSFEAGIDAIACTVGDAILVSHDVPKWANSGRIFSVEGDTLVLPIYISDTSKSYRIQYRTVKDTLHISPVTIVSSTPDGWTTVTLDDGYVDTDPPQAGDVFDVAIANIGSKPFVVKSITRAQDFTRRITCIEYAEALYDETYSIPPIQYAVRANGNAKNVTKLSASQYQYTDSNRVRHGVLAVSWKRPSNGGKFTVLISMNNKKWETVASGITNVSSEFTVKAKTQYYVKVITVLGVSQSSGVTIGPVAYGTDVAPSAVTGLAYKIDPADRTKAELTWDANNDIDFHHYEVTVGSKTYKTSANLMTIISAANDPKVSVVVVDNAGNRSTAVSLTVPIATFPSDVTGFSASQTVADRSTIEFKWNAVTDSDLSQYELRVGSTWASAEVFARTKTLRSTYQVDASGTYVFWIAAINAAEHYSKNPLKLSKSINIVPDAVTNLTVTQSTKDHSKAVISFKAPAGKDIAAYVIKYGSTWAEGTDIVETKETRYEWQVPSSGTYNVMVQVVTVAGQVSAIANKSITITVEPLDVTNFKAVQSGTDKTVVNLSWSSIKATDISHFIIKEGTTWETGTVVAPRVSGVTYSLKISEERLHSWMIKAVTIAGFESQYAASVSGIFGLNPTAVKSIQLRQNPDDRSQLQIQWGAVPDGDLVGYQVKVGDLWDSAEALPLTNELYASYTLKSSNAYHVMIRTLNSAGFYGDEASANLTCRVEPTNATAFVAYQNGEEVCLYWTASTDNDVVGYEIREGMSFDTGTAVVTGVTDNMYRVKVDMERLYRYHIKAINRAGFRSQTEATAKVTVENLPIKNVILTYDEIALQNGSHSHTTFGESEINFLTIGERFSDWPETHWNETGGHSVLKLLMDETTGLYPTSGTYTCKTIDVGQIITANITAYFTSSTFLTAGTAAKLQFRTSLDNKNWIGWSPFVPVQRQFRYVQFRVLLSTKDRGKTPEVNNLLVSIDVPDTDIALTANIAKGGTTVPFKHTFYTIPNVTASAIGDNLHAVVTAKTKTGCTVKVKNNANTDVGGTADIKIKGY